jgi:hypothetical protein
MMVMMIRNEIRVYKHMATENGVYNTNCNMHKQYYTKQLTGNSKPLNIHPALYSLMQKAVIFNTCHKGRKFLREQKIKSTLVT